MIDLETRKQIIELYLKGHSKTAIKKIMDVSRPTIRKILKAAHITKENQLQSLLKKEDIKEPSRVIDSSLVVSEEVSDILTPKLEEVERLQKPVDGTISRKTTGITHKTIGFTPRSLMFYEILRKDWFIGNFSDFVNISIYLAMEKRRFRMKNLKPRYIHPKFR